MELLGLELSSQRAANVLKYNIIPHPSTLYDQLEKCDSPSDLQNHRIIG